MKLTYRVVYRRYPSPLLRDPAAMEADLQRLNATIRASLPAETRRKLEADNRDQYLRGLRGFTRVALESFSYRKPRGDRAPDRLRVETVVERTPNRDEARRTIEVFDGRRTYWMTPDGKQTTVKSGNQVSDRSLSEEALLMGTPFSRLFPRATTKVSRGPNQTVVVTGPVRALGLRQVRAQLHPRRGYLITRLDWEGDSARMLSAVRKSGIWVPQRLVHESYITSPKYGCWHVSTTTYELQSATVTTW